MFSFRQRRNGVAIRFQGGEFDHAGFNALIDRIRLRLRAADLQPGDRVAALLPNSPELLGAYYACLLEGLVMVPLSVRLSPREVGGILDHSGSKLLLIETVNQGPRADLPVTAMDGLRGSVGRGPSDYVHPDPVWADDHPAVLFYTSGSSGHPKGVLYSHGTLRRNCRVYGDGLQVTASDHSVLTHCMASNFVFSQLAVPFLAAGATVEITEFGSVDQTLGAIRRGATFLSLIPWLGYQLIDAALPGDRANNRLRVAQVGGDSVPADYFRLFESAFGIFPRQMIGMTETNTYATNPMIPDDLRLESCGRPLPGVDVEIRDERGTPQPHGISGEIWVKTPAAMAGYWRDERQTRASMVDGWFRTGDAGRLDADGFLWFTGRLKNIIVRDGDNIHPREVELQIMRHPAVRWACVLGSSDPRRGQEILAVIVPSDPAVRIRLKELQVFLESRLAAEKIPQRLVYLDEMPKNRVGKLDRAALQVRVAQAG